MRSLTLPDGAVIELSGGDAHSGPGDCFSRLHVNTNVVWCRINGGVWMRIQQRSMHQAATMIELCENVRDVVESVLAPEEVAQRRLSLPG